MPIVKRGEVTIGKAEIQVGSLIPQIQTANLANTLQQAHAAQVAVPPQNCAALMGATTKAKAIAYGRELSEYEQLKDVRIGIAGITQAVIQSPAYAQFLMSAKSAGEADAFLKERVVYWLNVVKELSEGK